MTITTVSAARRAWDSHPEFRQAFAGNFDRFSFAVLRSATRHQPQQASAAREFLSRAQPTQAARGAPAEGWDNPQVRQEFGGDQERFLAYQRGIQSGRIKIFRPGQTRA